MRITFKSRMKNPVQYLSFISSIIHITSLLLLPFTFSYSQSKQAIYASYILWIVSLLISFFNILRKERSKLSYNILSYIFGAALIILYYLNQGNGLSLFVIYINVMYFSFLTSFISSIGISLFHIILHTFGKVLLLGMASELFNIATLGFITSGMVFGLLGEFLRTSLEKTMLLEESSLDTIKAFVETLEAKDEYTCGHSIRVSQYSRELAIRLGLPEEEVVRIERAALLHDIGKVGISDSILNKKGVLTDKEFDTIKTHPAIGVRILRNVRNVSDILPYIRSHHERVDGKGYPDGFKEANIPLGARIICIADSYEAMTSDRPYRKALGKEDAVRRLREGKDTQFSSELVDVFIEVLKDIDDAYKTAPVQLKKALKVDNKRIIRNMFCVNTLGSRIIYGLIIIGLVPILLGIVYITNISLSTISKFDENLRDQQIEALYSKVSEKKSGFEQLRTNYSNRDDIYERVAMKDYEWLDEKVASYIPQHYDVDIVCINDNNGIPLAWYNNGLAGYYLDGLMGSTVLWEPSATGVYSIDGVPYLISVGPILKSSGSGTSCGTILLGVELGEDYLKRFSTAEGLDINYIHNGNAMKEDRSLGNPAEVSLAVKTLSEMVLGDGKKYGQGSWKQYLMGIIPQTGLMSSNIDGYFIINYTGSAVKQAQYTSTRSAFLIAALAIVLFITIIIYMYNLVILPSSKLSSEISTAVNRLALLEDSDTSDEMAAIVGGFNNLIILAKEHSQKASLLSIKDGLTGLYNHSYCFQYMEELRETNTPFAFVRMDINSFRRFNEIFGYSNGDLMLCSIGSAIKDNMAKGDAAIRYDGDEFAVVTTYTDREQIEKNIGNVLHDIEELVPKDSEKMGYTLTMNVGYAIFPDDDVTENGIVDLAKKSMLQK